MRSSEQKVEASHLRRNGTVKLTARPLKRRDPVGYWARFRP